MRNWRIAAGSLCLLLSLTACVPEPEGISPGGHDPMGVAIPQRPGGEIRLPALPLWSPTGLTLTGEDRRESLSYTFAPLTMGGVELQPVRLPGGVVYLRLQGSDVWLHGTHSGRGGYFPFPEPRLLYRLPLKVGDHWEITYPGTTGSAYAYTVEAVEPVATTGGERPAVRVKVVRDGQPVRTEWWAPGYGLVRTRDAQGGELSASREIREAAREVEAVGRPSPGLKAILWDDGAMFRVMTLDGARELFRSDDAYWRSSYRWARAGAADLLWNSHVPGSWGLVLYSARAYSAQTGRLEPVRWASSAGEREEVVGNADWAEDGSFRLHDSTGYPVRWYTYRYDGLVLRTQPGEEQVIRAESAEALVRRLAEVPPLREGDFVAMFQSQAEGQQAWAALQAAGWQPVGGARVTALEQGVFAVEDGTVRFRVTVTRGAEDFALRDFVLVR